MDLKSTDRKDHKGRPVYSGGSIVRRFAAAYLILALACTLGLYGAWQNDNKIKDGRRERIALINAVNVEQCAALSKLYREIRNTVRTSDRSIDTIQYYKDNPEERARAHHLNALTLARFSKAPCKGKVVIGE